MGFKSSDDQLQPEDQTRVKGLSHQLASGFPCFPRDPRRSLPNCRVTGAKNRPVHFALEGNTVSRYSKSSGPPIHYNFPVSNIRVKRWTENFFQDDCRGSGLSTERRTRSARESVTTMASQVCNEPAERTSMQLKL